MPTWCSMQAFENLTAALDSARANKFRSALTMLGVIIGVTSVILLVSVGQGAKVYVTEQFASLGTNVLITIPGKTETVGSHPPVGQATHKLTVRDAIEMERRCALVDKVAPVVIGTSTVKFENRKRDVNIVGTTYDFQEIRNLYVEVGSFIPEREVEAESRVCVLGTKVRAELFGSDNPLGKLIKIGETKYRVIGIMKKKGTSLGIDLDDLVFVPVRSAQELFNTDGLLEILSTALNPHEIDQTIEQIKTVLKRRHNNVEDFTVISQGAMLSTFESILNALTYALGAIGCVSLIVGGIGIMNIMLVTVGERTKEIGIRKAVGAKNGHILVQFLVESMTLSGLGGVLGIALGIAIAETVRKLVPALPVTVSGWSILTSFGFSLAVGVFFGVYPARKAALMNPVEALRYE
ncbi:MAG: FtsX-like permease family protein [Planctomycetes bacterium]|nr:FtsX-like permease family protein [Planctomycetota bacterium]